LKKIENIKEINVTFCLNDNGDILIRLRPNKVLLTKIQNNLTVDHDEFGEENDGKEENLWANLVKRIYENNKNEQKKIKREYFEDNSLFYFESKNKKVEFIFFDEEYYDKTKIIGVSMNASYFFIWNLGKVWKINLETEEKSKLELYVSEDEKQTFIKKVRTGSKKDTVCVRVEQSPTSHCIIIWDLAKNIEIDSFDVKSNALFFQDKNGNPFFAEDDYLINCDSGCKLKCYSFT